MKKLTIIHTTVATVLSMPSMIQKMYPDQFEIVNVLDDSMLNEIKAKGDLTKEVTERFVQYAVIAKNNGSDAILLACSSIGEQGISPEIFLIFRCSRLMNRWQRKQ